MVAELTDLQALDMWRRAIVSIVRIEAPDLSARQMALLLTVYLLPPPHTVRGLAATLKVSKPAITRPVTRLSDLGTVRRKPDAPDRRRVLIQGTFQRPCNPATAPRHRPEIRETGRKHRAVAA